MQQQDAIATERLEQILTRIYALENTLDACGSQKQLLRRQEGVLQRIALLEQTTGHSNSSRPSSVKNDDTGSRYTYTQLSYQQQEQHSTGTKDQDGNTLEQRPRHSAGHHLAPSIANALSSLGVTSHTLYQVPGWYYDASLDKRKELLGAPSTYHLCKTIVMTNTRHPSGTNTSSKELGACPYVMVVVQYEAKLDSTKKLKKRFQEYARTSNNATNMRLAPEETAMELVGMGHNAMTPIEPVMNASLPVVASHRIFELDPPVLWLGGGYQDVKLSMSLGDFNKACNPYVLDITADE